MSLVIGFLVGCSMVAQAHPVRLLWPHPCGLRVINVQKGSEEQFKLLRTGEGEVTLDVPEVLVRIEGHSWSFAGWLEEQGEVEVASSAAAAKLSLQAHVAPYWPAGLLSLLILCLSLLRARAVRRRRIGEWRAEALQAESLVRSDDSVPEQPFGDFQCSQLLGRGAMGVVYRAHRADGTQAAIKVPNSELASDPEFRLRYQREAELGLELSHRHLVKTLAAGERPTPHIVLEWVDGSTLEAIPSKRWPGEWQRARRWTEQILDALTYLHGRNLIHRDIKPANVMLSREGVIKLMDLGIVHKLQGTRLTGTHQVLGSPPYMAPEQLTGSPVSTSIDLYSLGVLLYERLCGYNPFPQEFGELIQAKVHRDVPGLHDVDFEIPPEVSGFVEQLMDRNPAGRFASAGEALKALRRLR